MRNSPSSSSSVGFQIRTRSAPSTPTGAPSTSIRPLTLAERLKAAVYDLCTIKAIAPDGYVYTPEEWRIYSEGFYFAIARSLLVMDLAENNFKMRRRTRHAATKAQNRATAAAPDTEGSC